MRSLIAVLSFFLFASAAHAQSTPWQAFPSLRNVQALSASGEAIWAGTDGGVYRYAVDSGEIERYTPVQGLAAVDVRAIAYDARRRAVWIGYPDGVLDRLDAETGAVETFVDIARADQFDSRTINRIKVAGDSLLISTGFGLVVFDAVAEEVRDTYERFGTFSRAVETFDALRAPTPDGQDGLWVATRSGVAYAPVDAPNLREPSAWTADPDGPENVLSLAYFQGQVYAGAEWVREIVDGQLNILEPGDVSVRNGQGSWSRLFYGAETVTDLIADGDRLIVSSIFRLTVRSSDGSAARYDIDGLFSFSTVTVGPGDSVWHGDRFGGLLGYPDLNATAPGDVEPRVQVVPGGPEESNVLSVGAASGGEVWVGFRPSQSGASVFAGYDGAGWTNYSVRDGALDDQAPVLSIVRGEGGDVWLGSEGRGLYQVSAAGEVVRYTRENSSLARSGSNSSPNYVEVTGLAVDAEGNLWAANRFGIPPLHVRSPDGEWTGLQPPASIPSTVTYRTIMIDSFGYKWLGTDPTSTSGASGLIVLDTAGTPFDESDDRAVYVPNVGSVGTGLPNAEINAIVEDRSGRVWIGTRRGLATVFSPGSIFSGDPASQITWTRDAEGDDFFLRDLFIYDLAVDPADRKWIASSAGAWLLNAEGNEVIANFTPENSPLPVSEVLSVDIDEETGVVYFAVQGGVYSYRGGAIQPVREAEDLFVYPNPVRADGGALPTVTITGLVDNADVRVLTVDGQQVAAFATRGGSVSWDGRDQRTGQFVPSGVYIVAADGEGGTAHGKVAVIR